MNSGAYKTDMENRNSEISNEHCLNCGTELKGNYCHECGQGAITSDDSVKGFIQQYLDNAYMLDLKVLNTIWLLARRPGYLTSRFLSGKFMSHSHPIKLNMFLLFVFITILVLFKGVDRLNSSVHNILWDDSLFSIMQMDFLLEDEEYADKIAASGRDTVELVVSLQLAEQYPEVMTLIEVKEEATELAEIKDATDGVSADRWVGVVPEVLIEDKILVCNESGGYYFNPDAEKKIDNFDIVDDVWFSMVEIVTSYLPLFILFTAPLLAFSVRLVQRRHKRPFLHHLIFSLHYTAFVELLVLVIYIAYLTVSPPISVIKWVLILTSIFYLILAFREVYGVKSWTRTIIKAVFTNLIYQLICFFILIVIFLVACVIVADKYYQII